MKDLSKEPKSLQEKLKDSFDSNRRIVYKSCVGFPKGRATEFRETSSHEIRDD